MTSVRGIIPPQPNPRTTKPTIVPFSDSALAANTIIKSDMPVIAALVAARRFGCKPSINHPQMGFANSAGTDAAVIISAAVLLLYPASVIKGTV